LVLRTALTEIEYALCGLPLRQFPREKRAGKFFAEWIAAPARNFAISKIQIIQSSGHVARTGTIIAGRALFTAGRTPWSRNDSKPPVCPGE
jgi:hypothetical protein